MSSTGKNLVCASTTKISKASKGLGPGSAAEPPSIATQGSNGIVKWKVNPLNGEGPAIPLNKQIPPATKTNNWCRQAKNTSSGLQGEVSVSYTTLPHTEGQSKKWGPA